MRKKPKKRKSQLWLNSVWIEKRIVRHFRPGSRKANRPGQTKSYQIYIGHVIGHKSLVYRARRD